MQRKISKLIFMFFVFAVLIGIYGCGDNRIDEEEKTRIENDDQNPAHNNTEAATGENYIVRQGMIKVSELDQDNDGNVYQCPMDWNVIDDKPGSCPVCGMDLTKFAVGDAKKNLIDNGYQAE